MHTSNASQSWTSGSHGAGSNPPSDPQSSPPLVVAVVSIALVVSPVDVDSPPVVSAAAVVSAPVTDVVSPPSLASVPPLVPGPVVDV